ncbi:MAG: toll/interleukin-1 receptor domain-containing protein [Bosea sp.]|uniref:toll/interleukin-1 receptor domain-containing protein n=1 Tax=Bosea sp. (in: a-proteobacteria) TaxID=1871050 RepID=UPI001AC50684|nr:toll/interleukin-1 receptor domain-containing protein [Bosea sp. (in: a-proteobacteria)]MBN9452944.1 toll/interleukin-1 receptor domain-containing protein [Bosea sp. (in: a-proteobacteria)]
MILDFEYDVFISHASEDKSVFVRPLANALVSLGVRVWYDEHSIEYGDSIREKVDQGLVRSKCGIIVFSEFFLRKPWPAYELDGLVGNQFADNVRQLIPIWHNVTADQIRKKSPPWALRKALVTKEMTAEDISIELLRLVRYDLFEKSNLPDLRRRMSGKDLEEIESQLRITKEALSAFQCQYCKSPLIEVRSEDIQNYVPALQLFECGCKIEGQRLIKFCPQDPDAPDLNEYTFYFMSSLFDDDDWTCFASPVTENARRLDPANGRGRTKEEAMADLRKKYWSTRNPREA